GSVLELTSLRRYPAAHDAVTDMWVDVVLDGDLAGPRGEAQRLVGSPQLERGEGLHAEDGREIPGLGACQEYFRAGCEGAIGVFGAPGPELHVGLHRGEPTPGDEIAELAHQRPPRQDFAPSLLQLALRRESDATHDPRVALEPLRRPRPERFVRELTHLRDRGRPPPGPEQHPPEHVVDEAVVGPAPALHRPPPVHLRLAVV